RGRFYELDLVSTEAYLVTSHCGRPHICTRYIKEGFPSTDVLKNCYVGKEAVTYKIDVGEMVNPDNCPFKGKIHINSQQCYLTSDGKYVIRDIPISYTGATYYDIDETNRRALTEFGWCDYISYINDAGWMNNIPNKNLTINQINIPGTHDSGTYYMDFSSYAQTQNLDIYGQLMHGIRYFDIRVGTNNMNEIFINHNGFKCFNKKTHKLYFLKDIFDESIDFLHKYQNETVIIHLKEEKFHSDFKGEDVFRRIGQMTIFNNRDIVYNKPYSDYFYKDKFFIDEDDSKPYFPKLYEVQGKIVILTRDKFKYKLNLNDKADKYVGITVSIPAMGDCDKYGKEVCYPVVNDEKTIRVQDDYNLNVGDKIRIVSEVLHHLIPSRSTKSDMTYFLYTKQFTVWGESDPVTNKFYDTDNKDVLTINFMNIANADPGTSIESKSFLINTFLYRTLHDKFVIHNYWFIFDYPFDHNIRRIYTSNFQEDNVYKSRIVKVDNYTVYSDFNYYAIRSSLTYIRRNENNKVDLKACLQRKLIVDEQGNKQDVIKTNYKCVNNKMNKWRIKQSGKGKFYSILSSYDAKCINYDPQKNIFFMKDCTKNNKYEDFTINDGIICSRMDNTKCLDGAFEFTPTVIESPRYENLICSSVFAELGYECCYNENTKVEYVDEIGNWGIENGKLCGIGYERCSFSALDDPYPCCSSVNPEVVYTDESGNTWGYEDGQWCGIGEANYDTSFSIKNAKTGECLITDFTYDTDTPYTGECVHSIWTYKNNLLILNASGKCLKAMNAQDPRMVDCKKATENLDSYVYFEIVDNKYICIKNSVNQGHNCLSVDSTNGKSLKFTTSKNEYSEWEFKRWNEKWVDSIKEVITKNPDLKPEQEIIIVPEITTTIVPTSTPEPILDCYAKTGYPCCASELTEIISTDESGNWGYENGDWCLIIDSTIKTTTTTAIVKPTSSSDCYAKTGYPCCPPELTEIFEIDESGNIWGFDYDTDDWCIIIEKNTITSTTTTTTVPTSIPTSDTKPVWVYNINLKQCFSANTNVAADIQDKPYKPLIKNCTNAANYQWYFDPYPKGYLRSVINKNKCLYLDDVANGKIKVDKCNINDNA
ncbi:Non-catalytic module family DOC2, partial [Piromyces sp. E2]